MLQVGVVLGEAHGVIGRDERRRRREHEPLGLGGDVGEEDRRVGGRGKGRVVVLARGEDIESDLFRLLGDGDGGLDALVLRGRLAVGRVRRDVPDGEDAELHLSHSLLGS